MAYLLDKPGADPGAMGALVGLGEESESTTSIRGALKSRRLLRL